MNAEQLLTQNIEGKEPKTTNNYKCGENEPKITNNYKCGEWGNCKLFWTSIETKFVVKVMYTTQQVAAC